MMPKVSLVWLNGAFSVELCAADKRVMSKAREIGQALDAMQQTTGAALIEAVNAITDPTPEEPKPF